MQSNRARELTVILAAGALGLTGCEGMGSGDAALAVLGTALGMGAPYQTNPQRAASMAAGGNAITQLESAYVGRNTSGTNVNIYTSSSRASLRRLDIPTPHPLMTHNDRVVMCQTGNDKNNNKVLEFPDEYVNIGYNFTQGDPIALVLDYSIPHETKSSIEIRGFEGSVAEAEANMFACNDGERRTQRFQLKPEQTTKLSPGPYFIDLYVDDRPWASVPFIIEQKLIDMSGITVHRR